MAVMPRINAATITPSSPKTAATGSSTEVAVCRMLSPPTRIFAISQTASPAGAAEATALPSTNTVLSVTERPSVFSICGRRNGGSSRAYSDFAPLSRVAEHSFVAASVPATEMTISNVSKAG